MWDGSSLGERGARPATDGEPETFEGGFKDNLGCRPDGRCGVAGVVEMELSSLLDCRSAPRVMDCAVYTGLGASESDRDLGEVRFPGSRGVPLSDEASVFPLDSPSSARWDSCSLSLLSNRDAGKLGAKGKGVVDDVMLAIQGLVGLVTATSVKGCPSRQPCSVRSSGVPLLLPVLRAVREQPVDTVYFDGQTRAD
jgi:hypothetical protein